MAGQIRQERGERIALRVCSRSGNGTDHRKRGEPIRSALPVCFCSGENEDACFFGSSETGNGRVRSGAVETACPPALPGRKAAAEAGRSFWESSAASGCRTVRRVSVVRRYMPNVMRYYLCRLCLLFSEHFCVRLKLRRGMERRWVCVCGCGCGDGRRSRKMLPNLQYIERGA